MPNWVKLFNFYLCFFSAVSLNITITLGIKITYVNNIFCSEYTFFDLDDPVEWK